MQQDISANKGIKTIVLIVLFIVVVLTTMFSSVAYFTYNKEITGTITTGGNISHIVCDSTGTSRNNFYTFSNLSVQTYATPLYIKQTAGVASKLRVIVNVSFQDSNGNLRPLLFSSGNDFYEINMNTTAEWTNETVTDDQVLYSGSYWRFRDATSSIVTNDIIPVLTSINLKKIDSIENFTMIVTLTTELLQNENIGWEDI